MSSTCFEPDVHLQEDGCICSCGMVHFTYSGPGSSVSIATDYGLDGSGIEKHGSNDGTCENQRETRQTYSGYREPLNTFVSMPLNGRTWSPGSRKKHSDTLSDGDSTTRGARNANPTRNRMGKRME